MQCKKPKYKYVGDGHVMCDREECPYLLKSMFVNERTKEQWYFTGCPDLLNLFYLREMWLRTVGLQKVGEQTRNLVLAGLDVDDLKNKMERIRVLGETLITEEKGKADDVRRKPLQLEKSGL